MRKPTASYTLECDVDTYWEIFLDEAFTKELHSQQLGTRELEVLEQTDTTRRLRVAPKLSMPKAVQKLLGDSFVYEEQGTLERDTNTWRWKIVPNTMTDKLSTFGTFRLEPLAGGKCKRHDEATIEELGSLQQK